MILSLAAPALAIWGIWAVTQRGRRAAEFSTLYIGLSLAAYFVQSMGEGVIINAQFELVVAIAIGLALTVDGSA